MPVSIARGCRFTENIYKYIKLNRNIENVVNITADDVQRKVVENITTLKQRWLSDVGFET